MEYLKEIRISAEDYIKHERRKMKDYLVYENGRNHDHHGIFTNLVQRAFGMDTMVLVAHHITLDRPGEEPIEIPSADTMLFDHDIMIKIFGEQAIPLMQGLASVPCEQREAIVTMALSRL